MLQALGLSAAEEAVYQALLAQPHMSLGELRDSGVVGRQPPEPILSSLEEKGLVSRLPGTPRRFTASSPEYALEILILAREEELRQARSLADQLAQRFRNSRRDDDPAELVEVVSGADAVLHRWIQMLHSARRDVCGLDRPPYSETTRKLERQLVARGVSYRCIYGRHVFDEPARARALLESVAGGEQARVMSGTPMKLFIVDGRHAMIALEKGTETIQSAVVIHPSSLLDALGRLFDGLWQRAVPVTQPTGRNGGTNSESPSEHDAALLTLLATGLTDEAIARQLDVSQRTVQRYIRGLMDRLGADTRFQAGLQAARRGWL
jgi:DNA-binding CsgD family transcriptional regulator/DNA-binding MarR family transcriptional regulator